MTAAENSEGLCKETKETVPCSLVAIKAHDAKNYKSLAFIKKMRNVAQKILTGCNGSLRVEVGKLFKQVWSELKCERGGKGKQMGQRYVKYEFEFNCSGFSKISYFVERVLVEQIDRKIA